MLYCTSGQLSGLARRLLEACGFDRGSHSRLYETAGPQARKLSGRRSSCLRNGAGHLFHKDCPEGAEPLSEIKTSAPGKSGK